MARPCFKASSFFLYTLPLSPHLYPPFTFFIGILTPPVLIHLIFKKFKGNLYALYINILITEFSNLANYSTSESDTGMRWIDSKPIYRKVVNFGALPNASTKAVNHGISNLNTVVNFYGNILNSTTGDRLSLNVPSPSGPQYDILTTVTNTQVKITCSVDRSHQNAIVVIEYTKS